MMTSSSSRKLEVFNKVFKVLSEFYATIIVKKLKEINKIKNFRNVENLMKSNIKISADINYLKFCVNNQLLPKFLNFKLYDVSLHHDNNTVNFKKRLLQNELKKQEEKLQTGTISLARELIQFRLCCRGLYYYAAMSFLRRLSRQHEKTIYDKHNRKLCELYGSCLLYTSDAADE